MTARRQPPALSLEELDLWLASAQAPAPGGWNVPAVDGLIAGIIVGPEPIAAVEWTRLIFGARPLGPEGTAARQAMLDRHEAVATILTKAPARYATLFLRTERGEVLAQDWAAGFLAAIRLRLAAWRPLLEGPPGIGLLLPILVYTPDPVIKTYIAQLPPAARHHLAEAYHHIPAAVTAIRDLFLPVRHAKRAEPATPRRVKPKQP